MLLEEFDVDKYERTLKNEGREEGEERLSQLTIMLLRQNRIDDVERMASDAAYRKRLFREFDL